MAKLAQTSVKYLIRASFTADGLVEKPDVIGALFGQTEGLLGPELDLRELQRTGRIGRVEVTLSFKEGKTKGDIVVPSSLDSTETALIAAALETIERVGPCTTKIVTTSIEDLRSTKRRYMMDRAKELLSGLMQTFPEPAAVTEELMQSVRAAEVVDFRGLPAGPDAATADSLILVEGRADIVNLLRNGVKNVLAFGGTQIPAWIVELSKERETTAFLDGDRGGDLILKELIQVGVDLDFVARAPEGKEVEELTKKEIFKALREQVPFEQAAKEERATPARGRERERVRYRERESPSYIRRARQRALTEDMKTFFKTQVEELIGTRAAAIFDKNLKFSGRVPLRGLSTSIKSVEGPFAIVLDGRIDRNLIRLAEALGVQWLVGSGAEGTSSKLAILTFEDLLR